MRNEKNNSQPPPFPPPRLMPSKGLVDLQVNGFAGVDFNADTLTVREVELACEALHRESVAYFLPTLVTNDPAVLKRNLRTILQADDRDKAGILGFHLEGPFISPCDGARGAHPPQWVKPPDLDWIERMQETAEGSIQILTMSPEWEGSARFIESVVSLGIRVAIGHTLATPDQIADAVKAGASLATHLGNGIPAILPRHPNPIWSQLAENGLWASVIGDGFHLSREVFTVIHRLKKERLFLVSDSTQFAGMTPGRYQTLIGGDVVLTAAGKLHLAENEALFAGSAMSLKRMIETIAANGWLSYEEAWHLGSTAPWNFLKNNLV
ncbi:MAG: hypothetical protein FWC43_11600 [Planctomycetaceae bacterium]|nr:hypothetical protein [Planctomycetaceae bacterium]